MKKILFTSYILLFLVFFTGCKNPVLEFEWDIFEGEGSYSSATDQSYFMLKSRIKLDQSTVNINPQSPWDTREFQSATIIFWECMLVDGEAGVLLFNGETVNERFGNIYTNISDAQQVAYLWIFIESEILIENDVYNGKNPDRIILRIRIRDSDGNYTDLEKEIDFKFTRE